MKWIVRIICAIRSNIIFSVDEVPQRLSARRKINAEREWKRWKRCVFFLLPKIHIAMFGKTRQFRRLAATTEYRNLKSSTRCNSSHTYKKYMDSTGPATPTCVWRREQRRIRISTISVYLSPSAVCERALSRRVLSETLKCCWRT